MATILLMMRKVMKRKEEEDMEIDMEIEDN